ncbi:MAG: hypothetical protein AAFO91_17560, partial [Bacteroidota bacterium]
LSSLLKHVQPILKLKVFLNDASADSFSPHKPLEDSTKFYYSTLLNSSKPQANCTNETIIYIFGPH